MSASTSVNIPWILGTIEIGVILNTFLLGVVTIQMFSYYSARFNDPSHEIYQWRIHILLWWVYTLDLAYSMIAVEMLWVYTVSGFGDLTVLASGRWEYFVLPVFISAASVPIQFFLAYRVKKLLAGKLALPAFMGIALMSTCQGVIALYMTIAAFTTVFDAAGNVKFRLSMSYPSSLASFTKIGQSYTAISLCTDVLITGSLTATLLSKRTGFKTTDNIVLRIILTSIETAIPVTIFGVSPLQFPSRGALGFSPPFRRSAIWSQSYASSVDILAARLMFPQNTGSTSGIAETFVIPVARLYTNTLLVTLNQRAQVRAQLSSTSHNSGNNANLIDSAFNRARGAQVRIQVEEGIVMKDFQLSKGEVPGVGGSHGSHGDLKIDAI
ncbi:uncharacterized protein BT62DRAFT_919237 [Guyanagaster necrorhizus]|uniref:DUF6534 domain-containing protein n=1 Tax=Guyanagaster necrorhizus TaxID=856835 RepID=A0A9P7VVQ1_9AGAR|nr:uncharacterized protein BT62DRAFT_919237 [Guyanagaster necrorhizus MCA 3950]KAG7447330.1 hypothetical protein BT62DRAFT_919237 [Guyanagaster necrorhizus MCA 3950]